MKASSKYSPSLNTQIHGNSIEDYEILHQLGKGSNSVVHKVKCLKCGLYHALKIVTKKQLKAKNLAPLLVNEMKLHNTLRHERIVRLLQCFEDSDCIYLLTELCEGGELNSLVKTKKMKLGIQEIHRLFCQIVEGVKYLHDNRVIHRDLKLANIMLTDKGDIKIGDFGLAVQLKDFSEERETMCGTPNYMSPEIIVNNRYSFEADVWSLGCILYTLVVGCPPFEGPKAEDTLLNVKKGTYKMPINVPNEIKDLIAKLLKYNKEERITVNDIMQQTFFLSEYPETNAIQSEQISAEITPEKPPKPSEKPKIPTPSSKFCSEENKENIPNNNNFLEKKTTVKKQKNTLQLLRSLNTERIKPIIHNTPQGYIKIDKEGYVELELSSRAKIMRISPNGQKISIQSKLIEGCITEFNLANLPSQFASIYKYAYDFVSLLRTKTPKVTIKMENCKISLMDNEPYHNIEMHKKDGLTMIHQISSHHVTIIFADKSKLMLNKTKIPKEYQIVVSEFFELVKKCEETERKIESENGKFPVIIKE